MKMLKIELNANASHDYTISSFIKFVPEGWAVIPDNMEIENFPFGEVEAAEIDGVMTVTKWIPGIIPEPEPVPELESTSEPTLEERVILLEEQLAETDEAAIQLYEASLIQEAINAEHDEAIIEIYETMEGLLNG